ncbi:PGF-CTERM-anchored ABC transporter substrate-binding protein [Halomicroarcula sp. GCM10025817]|uniref:PGF-CTERM-anchored ABC transporter substrate-binding protein n=1 Tax=Haloarcula TaxID=2237 RepID=UPI0023E77C6B|nr:PGF-CTERM-anchored ABC transporter substrate-binding protein [Halomicroarcula sp. SYNS111]
MRRYATLLVGLLLVTSLVGVAPAAGGPAATTSEHCTFPVTMTDATGTEIPIEERPERVVTTNPSAAQTMWEIGGREQVVGLTQYASYLDGSESRTNVSAGFGVSVETVVGAEPDLVIAPNASAGDVEPLREAGLTVYHLRASEDIADVREKTETVGRITGNCQGAAEANAWMDANVEAIREQTADVEDRPTALYPLGGGYVVGGATFIDALLQLAGADNVAARDHTGYPQLSDEVLLTLDPEVLVLAAGDDSLVTQEPYASTTAGETNSTVVVERRWLNQPAPRSVVFAAHNLTRQLYPDRYDEDSYVARSDVTVATETETATRTDEPTPASPALTTEPSTTDGGSGPGFTPLAALVAALAASLLALRRR